MLNKKQLKELNKVWKKRNNLPEHLDEEHLYSTGYTDALVDVVRALGLNII